MRSISKLSHTPGVHRTEFDSHVDALEIGNNTLLLLSSGETYVPIVTAAIAYDCVITGNILVIIMHNTLYIDNMNQNLIPPIMLRLN